MFHFQPSTRQLFQALTFDWPDPNTEEEARDIYRVNAALTDWKNALYHQLSEAAMDYAPEDFTASAQAQLAAIVPDALKGAPLFAEPETFWKISFDFEGVSEAVFVPGGFAWMNDAGLALHFDALLARSGRPERVLRFGDGRNESSSFRGRYIIAPPQQFSALCSELGIPLQPFTGAGHG
jgi:hypothetical protein